MNVLAIIVILLLIVGIASVLIALGQLWAVGGGVDDPVGSRLPRKPSPPPPSIVPGSFRTLIYGESLGWKQDAQWDLLTHRLDQLEIAFGGAPTMASPDRYSAEWLDARIARIEALAGPLPEPMRPTPPATASRWPWKKR